MRVLHLITRLDPGGAEHHLLHLCRGMARRSCDVTVAYLKGEGRLTPSFEQAGCRVVRTGLDPILTSHPVRVLRTLGNWVRRLRPDVVHTHMPKAEIFGNPAAGSVRGPKVVSTKHNDDPYWMRPTLRWLHRWTARWNDHVIVPSEHLRGYTRRVGCSAPVEVIPYGLDADAFLSTADPEAIARWRREFAKDGRRVVGCLARLEPQKGLFDLAGAARQLPENVAVVVLGQGSLEGRLRGERALRVLGPTSEVASTMGAFDVLCLPSRWEGFGMVLLEAMAAGVPIVATRVSSIPEVVEDGQSGLLVPPRDPVALAGALRRVLDEAPLRRRLVSGGRQRVLDRFNLDRMVESTLQLYERPRTTW